MLGISYKALLYKMRQFNLDSGRGSRATRTGSTSLAKRVVPLLFAKLLSATYCLFRAHNRIKILFIKRLEV